MLGAEVGVGEHPLGDDRRRVGVQDPQQFRRTGEVGQPVLGVGRLDRDGNGGRIDGVQLREHAPELHRCAWGRGSAQQRTAGQQWVGEHTPQRVGE